MGDGYHTPVLVDAALQFLRPHPKGIYVDGTLGGGGHAEQILTQTSPNGVLIGFDMDEDAITSARVRLEKFGKRMYYVHDNVAHLRERVRECTGDPLDGVLLDLGVSSHHLDEPDRGFSFQENGRIDMRMDRRANLDGWKVINTYAEDRLANILHAYGEEIHSRKIAKRIVRQRDQRTIDTTRDLADVVAAAVGPQFLHKTLARVFQAVRIEVNHELENLRLALTDGTALLRSGGTMVVIAYHSLEDRIVKDYFKDQARTAIPSGNKYVPDEIREPSLRILTKRPVMASESEVSTNPRARSAKLRAAEKV